MLTLDEAFRKFRSRLELNDREQNNASSRHQEMREHLRGDFALDDDFLTGSYRRHTKTKPLKDVDIFLLSDLHPLMTLVYLAGLMQLHQ